MKYYLMVFMLIGNDGWRIGDHMDGPVYAPRPFESLDKCLEYRWDRQRTVPLPPGVKQMYWNCVPDMGT